MKRSLALLLSFVFIFSFSSCGQNKQDEASMTEQPQISEIGATAKVVITEDNRGVSSVINDAQIPTFTVDGDSAAIIAINEQIESEILSFCDAAANEPLRAAKVITKVIDTGRYLQAVVTYGYSYGSIDGNDVRSYIYDKVKDTMVTSIGTDIDQTIIELFNEKVPSGELIDSSIKGFAFTSSQSIQYFVKIKYNSGAGEQSELVTIIPETKSFEQVNADGSVFVKE